MILLTLVGSFMTFTGIILHAISRMIHEGVNIKKGRENGGRVPVNIKKEFKSTFGGS